MISLFPSDHQSARPGRRPRAPGWALICAAVALAVVPVTASGSEPVFKRAPEPVIVERNAAKFAAPAQLILDDGSWEGTVGFVGEQFLWFNQFSLGGSPYELQEVSVLFPSASGVSAGDAIQIAVWHDPDGDPTNGADLLTSFGSTIQSVDGTTFSVYPIAPSIVTPVGGDLLVGVINRYVIGGVPGGTSPAAIDTTTPQGRSWYATWTTDPPDPPALPSDDVTARIDPFVARNWMIRAHGLREVRAIPAQTPLGVVVLILVIAVGGAMLVSRRG